MTRITEVGVALHQRARAFAKGASGGTVGVLTIVTESGHESTVFVSGAQTVPELNVRALAELVRPQLVGLDALDIGAIWERLWKQERALNSVVIGAVDTALWDIAGQVAGLPIHRLLGTVRHEIPAYVSSWLHEHPEDYAAEAAHYQQLGFTAYKFHPTTQWRSRGGRNVPLSEDILTARLVREAVGPDMKLMFDSPLVYSYEEAVTMGKVLEELDYHWYEDPLPPDDIYGYQRLRQQLRIPLLATEMTGGGPYAYAPWILGSATDYLRGDVAFKGGITPLMKIARTAELFRLGFELHDGFNATGNLAGAHVAMAVPNGQFFEILTIQDTGVYGFDNFNYGLAEPIAIVDGKVQAPTGAGLGHALDHELIQSGIIATY